MKTFNFVSVILISTLLAGCANEAGKVNKTTTGGLMGGAMGAILGSTIGSGTGKVAAMMVGTLLGAGIGASIGNKLDKEDVEQMKKAGYQALENGKDNDGATWSNPNTGASGTITPTKTFVEKSGRPCREYVQNIKIGGETSKAIGTACRRPDGYWEVVS